MMERTMMMLVYDGEDYDDDGLWMERTMMMLVYDGEDCDDAGL